MMEMSHYFYAMMLGFGIAANVTTVVAMRDIDEDRSPIAMGMGDRVDESTLRDNYSFEELMTQPIEKLKVLGKALMAEASKEIEDGNCLERDCVICCCQCIPILNKLKNKLKRNFDELSALVDTNEDFPEKKTLITMHICAIAETNA